MNMQAELLAQVVAVGDVVSPVGAGLIALVAILGIAALAAGARSRPSR